MPSLNRCELMGHLGKDPESKIIGDKHVCNFDIATRSAWKEGETWKDRTEWHRIQVWGRTAELCSTVLHKGSLVYIEGEIRHRKYEKDGETKYITEITASKVLFLDKKKDSDEAEWNANDALPF